ncbi:NAD(P)/FAD-dependent oxidoreductase [Fredinandcohnia sp. 179-A 10B2 NHS]|uniref:NAD(P)/FAD-dependent oxidoreductase n=1 Tax=Fredinandcohnia sp. 179-A 10B2 NHS TaxID=3235176 RepID=UPI00399F2CB3
MKQQSMWEVTANPARNRTTLKGSKECDVVIVGGGFTGLSTAYHLQKRNVKTIVLEKNYIGSGASGRNGGQILTGFIDSMSALAKKRGLETARKMLQMSLDSIDLIEKITKENKISCSFQRSGHLYAAFKESHIQWLKEEQEALARDFNYKISVIEKNDLKSELNTDFYYGGSIDEQSATFHPFNYVLGMADTVESLGGEVYENSEAIQIKKLPGNKVTIETAEGRVTAEHLVIVTNAYSGDLHKTISRSVIPVESIMIATERLPEELVSSLIPKNRAVFDTKHMLYYFRRTPDNRIVFGGSGRSISSDIGPLFVKLQEGMNRVFPELKNHKVEYSWSGKVGFTRDMLPYIGQLEDGTHFAFGYAGHGAAMSTLMGKLLAENILSENKGNNPFEKNDLRPIPFFSQHGKVVGLMKYYFKMKDAIS